MAFKEPALDSKKSFAEQMVSKLTAIHTKLSNVFAFHPDSLKEQDIDAICATLSDLEERAQQSNELALVEVLSNLNARFYVLNTTGVIDNSEKFADQAGHAFDLLETTLLLTDPSGQVLKSIKARKTTF